MAYKLWEATDGIPGVEHDGPPIVNSLFPRLPREAITALREWCFFWDWDTSRNQVRWMTAWDTTDDEVGANVAANHSVFSPTKP
jgi:threonine aldolase